VADIRAAESNAQRLTANERQISAEVDKEHFEPGKKLK
jgi:hypothetical protein